MNPLTLLLIVEQAIIPQLTPALDQYRDDLNQQNWSITTLEAPALTNRLDQNNWIVSNVWPKLVAHSQVFLVGNVPMPRAGLWLNPDGHASQGCYSAPAFYVTPPTGWEKWTDERFNTSRGWLTNTVNDGKFDNQTLPNAPVAGLGMVNFIGVTDNVARITNYFARLHEYRLNNWNVTNLALYAYPSNTTRWRDTPGTVPQLVGSFGAAVKFNAERVIRVNWTNNQPAVELLAYKCGDFAPMLWKGAAPKSVAWFAWNSGQYELRSFPNTRDVYSALATPNGPLIIALNHPDWPVQLTNDSTWGDIWRTTFSAYGSPTWSWLMGDPTLIFNQPKKE